MRRPPPSLPTQNRSTTGATRRTLQLSRLWGKRGTLTSSVLPAPAWSRASEESQQLGVCDRTVGIVQFDLKGQDLRGNIVSCGEIEDRIPGCVHRYLPHQNRIIERDTGGARQRYDPRNNVVYREPPAVADDDPQTTGFAGIEVLVPRRLREFKFECHAPDGTTRSIRFPLCVGGDNRTGVTPASDRRLPAERR